MSSSVFTDRSTEPTPKELKEALGETAPFWSEIRHHLETEHGPLAEEWKFYSAKSGWTMKTLRKKRNLFFLTPLDGCFRLGFVFGDRAVAAIEGSDVPDSIKEELRSAKRYTEGRVLALEVRTREDIGPVKTLVAIKVDN